MLTRALFWKIHLCKFLLRLQLSIKNFHHEVKGKPVPFTCTFYMLHLKLETIFNHLVKGANNSIEGPNF